MGGGFAFAKIREVGGVMRDFRLSFVVTGLCLALAGWWGHASGMGVLPALWLVLVLGVLEVSLSFDNAVVNASVLKHMSERWRQLFLTVGILIAVFGMRLVFPILIVAVATGEGFGTVVRMALEHPDQYASVLTSHYPQIAAFGGMFLLLVFLSFIFDTEREHFWVGPLEHFLAKIGKADAAAVIVAIAVLLLTKLFVPVELFGAVLLSGLCGILLFLAVDSVDAFFEVEDADGGSASVAKRAGVAAFLYLEVLDASFSFDGVIGAFAITRDVVVIMLGLAVGAMFVRSLTVYLVHKGTLDQFVFLEHGAHYAIGVLAGIMLLGIVHHVPEVVTGLIGVFFIAASIWSSIRYRRRNPELTSPMDAG